MNKKTYNQLTVEDINANLKDKQIEIVGEYVNSKTLSEFRCKLCNGHFYAKYDLVRYWKNVGCKQCNNLPTNNFEKYQKMSKRINNQKSKYIDVLNIELDSNIIECKCLLCNDTFTMKYNSVIRGSMHRPCSFKISSEKQRDTVDDIKAKIKELNKNITVDFSNYIDKSSILECRCNVCGYIWNTRAKNVSRDRNCPQCAQKRRDESRKKPLDNYVDILKELDITLIGDYNCATYQTLFMCNKCHSKFTSSFSYLKNFKIGCTVCSKKEKLEISEINFIEMAHKKNPRIKMISHFITRSHIGEFYCEECRKTFQRSPHEFLRNPTCPCCNTNSTLEYLTKVYLNNKTIGFELHKRYDDLYGINNGNLSYDFFIPDYNTLIECQGEQHYKPVEMFGGEEQFTIQQEHDRRKREYAKNHHINLLEIKYSDESRINDILDDYFNNAH